MKLLRLLIVSLVLIVAGCGGGGSASTPTSTPPVTTNGTLQITNNTGQPISAAYMASSPSSGYAQIATSIVNGSSRDVANIPAGTYDIMVLLADGSTQHQYGVSIAAGTTATITFNAPAPGTLQIFNITGQAIDVAYITPASASTWGVNQIDSSIANGSSRDIANIPTGMYHVLVVLADGSTQFQYGVSIYSEITTTVTFIAPGSLQITNSTGQEISSLYVTSGNASTWGVNQLGSNTILDGASFTLSNMQSDVYNIMVVLADGTVQYQYEVSVSDGITATITFSAATVTNGAISISNNSGQTINSLHITPSSGSTWGVEQLGGSTVPDGTSFTLNNIAPGSYHIVAAFADGTVQYKYSVSVSDGATTTVTFDAAPTTGALQINNSSGQTINALYVSPTTSATWGANQLGASAIPNGTSFTLNSIPPDSYDIMVVLADGTVQYQSGVSISAGATTTVTFSAAVATTGALQIVNSSGQTINYLYVSPTTSSNWGVNQLGTNTLPNGMSFTLNSIPPDSYDVMVVLADNTTRTEFNVAISAGQTLILTVIP